MVNCERCYNQTKHMQHQIARRVWNAINLFIHLILLSIFVYCFGYSMVRDYIHSSTVFTEKTIKYNDLPGITFVNLIAGSSAWNHGWKLVNLDAEKPILEEVCTKYSNFTSTYTEYVNCIDEQAFNADDLILSWYNGIRWTQYLF